MMVQSRRERRDANRVQKAESRQRSTMNAKWRVKLGDIDTGRKILAADDDTAEEFMGDELQYPYPKRGNPDPLAANRSPGTPQAPYDVACDLLEFAAVQLAPTVNVDQAAKRGDRSRDDIDRAVVDGWADMQREACNAIAEAKRELSKPSDPPIPDHDDQDCPRCNWRAITL